MKKTAVLLIISASLTACISNQKNAQNINHQFNGEYSGDYLSRIAFPLGGIGAGMICIEGNACISHVSVRHKPDLFNEPYMLATIAVKGVKNSARVLEGPVQDYKIFGNPYTGNGAGNGFGFPRFDKAFFNSRFPFATISLKKDEMPVEVSIQAWSPFIPGDADNSSLPVAGLEYSFTNTSKSDIEAVFAYHSQNFMRISQEGQFGPNYDVKGDSIKRIPNGFILSQSCFPDKPHYKGDYAIFTAEDATVDYCWFRGGWFDGQTQMWKDVESLNMPDDTNTIGSTAASLYVPIKIKPGETKTVHLMMAWYVPHSDQRYGATRDLKTITECSPSNPGCCSPGYTGQFYEPWYSGRFKDIHELINYWKTNYADLQQKSELFSNTFYSSDLPAEVIEAVSANLSILKSPTLLRQKDGKLWGFEGCFDSGSGCCYGSCTHVWNYAQAIPHLFPSLERSLRETEFLSSQDTSGHQNFRSALPIDQTYHNFHAAADGQLGGIIKVYRDWHISGNTEWLKTLWPNIKESFSYCSHQWDPKQKGVIVEPHHNTYDIEFWGPDGMCNSFYLAAMKCMDEMSEAVGSPNPEYKELYALGSKFMDDELFNGEYYIQKVQWEGLKSPNPLESMKEAWNINYSPEALELLKKEGPKYQYGNGCLSDGVLGSWMGEVSGLPPFLNPDKVKSHLLSVYKYNFKTNLSDHVNPQRPGFALGNEGGLLLCSWPHNDEPALPFVYCNEVFTGIEYQVASHLMLHGEVEKGLEIVREARKRYDGRIRNPFDEYECGHWYARALSSYALLQGLTGLRYDALSKSLYLKKGKDFRCFISTESGYGLAGLKNGKPFVDVKSGTIDVQKFILE